jgi:ADP-heptose:LPS heptosyltransferase
MKTAVVVRYGGIGDMFQASSVLPGLKAQGYRVVMNTTPSGQEVLKHDPHIDDWIIQQPGEVAREKLSDHWRYISERCDKFINLSETVEGVLYPTVERAAFYWPKDARHFLCDIDQVHLTHLVAGVPPGPCYRFYATPKEQKWAFKIRKRMGGKVILWVLSGSSVHKVWPYLDQCIARIMLRLPDVKVVLVGEELAQILEMDWKNEPRVIGKCGKWSVRKTLAFAHEADLVIGPETGVLYGMGLQKVPKIVTLSHSSMENLYNHWRNVVALMPEACECYPCHRLHNSFDFCHRDEETGVALCQAKISLDAMWDAIKFVMEKIGEKNNDLSSGFSRAGLADDSGACRRPLPGCDSGNGSNIIQCAGPSSVD